MNTVLNDTTSARRLNRHLGGIILEIDAADYSEDGIRLYLRLG